MQIEMLAALLDGTELEFPSASQWSIHSSVASVTVILMLAGVCVPCATSCRAVTAQASASFFVAKVFSRRFPLWST